MRDRHDMGPSRFIPRQPGESWYNRHTRREKKNEENVEIVAKWCVKHRICFEDFMRWSFYADGKFAEWSPFDASLVINGRYDDSLHIHDYKTVMQALSRYFGIPQPTAFDLAHFGPLPKRR